MFNSYSSNNNQSLHINAVTGSILKNHPKSWFLRFNLKSHLADRLLVEGGNRNDKSKSKYDEDLEKWIISEHAGDIIILQMMLCGDMEVIAECVYRKDYESYERDDDNE